MRPRALVFLAISVVVCSVGLWSWRSSEEATVRRLEAWEFQQRLDATDAGLGKIVSLSGGETSLKDFAAAASTASGLAIDVDFRAIEVEYLHARMLRFQVPQGRLSVRAALKLTLEPHDLCYDVHDQRLEITTLGASRDRTQLRTVVYPLPQPEFASAAVDAQTWHELITTTVAPEQWDEVGGSGHCEAVPGALIVVQSEHIHRQVRAMIDSLSRLQSPPESFAAVPIEPFLASSNERSILAELGQPTAIDCRVLPLAELLEHLSQRHQIPILLDRPRLREAGVSAGTLITVQLPDVTLQAALRQVLDQVELALVLRDETLIVTSPDEADRFLNLPLVAYPVHDLVDWPSVGDYDSLIDLVTTTVAPENWVDVGGTGTIVPLEGWLLVTQSWDVQQQIEQLFMQIRRTLRHDEPPSVLGSAVVSPSERKVRAALDAPIALKFAETPLDAALQWIAEELDIPVVVDQRARIDLSTPVTCKLPAAPLRSQLRLLLDQCDLTFAVSNEALTITTPDDAERELHVRVYDVRPLLDPDLGVCNWDELYEAVSSLVAVESWTEVGGPGEAQDFRGLLVVRQTEAIHRRVEQLLKTLEENCLVPGSGLAVANAADSPWIVTVGGAPAQQRIQRVLGTAVDVDYQNEPLAAALEQLAARHHLPLVLDGRRLEEAGIDRRSPVTIRLRGVTLRSVFRQIFEELELAGQIRDDAFVVTTQEESQREMPLVAYRVDDLLARTASSDSDDLIDAITTIVAPESWESRGGTGAVKALGGWLLVGQTLELHEQIEQLLTQIRNLPRGDAANDDASTRRIRSALGREIAPDATDDPFPAPADEARD